MERFHQKLKALTLDNMLMSNDKEILCLEVFLVVMSVRVSQIIVVSVQTEKSTWVT